MAAASLQLISVFQETAAVAPAPQTTTTTPVDPNQAQGATVPQDTVTLSGQAAQGQQTGQDTQQQAQFRETVITFAEAQIFAPAITGNPGAQPPAAVPGAPTTANTLGQASAAEAAANAAKNNTGPQSPQQQLQQLDQALQQLGINPESISLFNRMAMLLYADDPAALQSFIQQLQQQVAQQQTAQPAATGAVATNPQAGAQQLNQPPTAANASTSAGHSLNADGGANQPSASGSAAVGNNVFVQFEELQVAFGATGPGQSLQSSAASSASISQGQALSVTA